MTRRALATALIAWFFGAGTASAGRLCPGLELEINALPPGGVVSVIVEMTDQADPRGAVATLPVHDRRARARAVVSTLQGFANQTQGPIRAFLARAQASGHVRRGGS